MATCKPIKTRYVHSFQPKVHHGSLPTNRFWAEIRKMNPQSLEKKGKKSINVGWDIILECTAPTQDDTHHQDHQIKKTVGDPYKP